MATSSLRAKTIPLAGWGNFPRQNAPAYRPERNRELREVVSNAEQTSLISRGLGRSYGDASMATASSIPTQSDGSTTGAAILHARLNRILAFDSATAIVEAEAGVTLEDLLNVFVPKGFFLPVTPGTKFVSLGGAIAADVHGKNHHREGSIGNFVTSLRLMLANGQTVTCSPVENTELFWATVGGMGLTGAIVSAQLKLIPIQSAYISVDYKRAPNLDAALADFGSGDDAYQYSVAWIDCLAKGPSLGRSILIRGNHAKPDELPPKAQAAPLTLPRKKKKSIPFNAPNFALNSLSVKAFNALFYKRHKDSHKIIDYDEFFYPLDSVLHWNRMYGKRGFIQYQALFPHATARAGLIELLEQFSASKRASFLAVLKTMGKANPGILSFPFEGQTLALDLPNTGDDLMQFLARLDEIVLKHEGRIYFAKDARMSAATAARMYPSLPRFAAIKEQHDPNHRFDSALAQRLNLKGAL